tara:strand:+ start:547 stop:672 length:126 start_codon:yes stop_codon:yes gene_type:complete
MNKKKEDGFCYCYMQIGLCYCETQKPQEDEENSEYIGDKTE